MSRPAALVVALAAAVVIVLGLPALSSASYVASSSSTATVTAASDWTPPTVTVTDPGPSVKGSTTINATAADGETGVASVIVQYLAPNGSSWVDLCTDTTAPYSCSWATTTVPDGTYSLRARATDNAGYSTNSSVVTTTVANNLVVVLGHPGDVVRGTVPLAATLYGAGPVSYSVAIQYAPAGSTNQNAWKTICTTSTSPYTCSWATAASGNGAIANGDYDLRAVATSGGTSTTSATVLDVTVDNAAPSAVMLDPGATLRGTVTLAASADDAESGVARVVIQLAGASGAWNDACTITASPWSCSFDTTKLADGTYSFRAVVTDVAGNTTTSAAITGRTVDNTVSSVSVNDPGAYLSGTVSVTANANSTVGVTAVVIQRAPTGSGTWTTLCTDTSAPYACSWDTSTVADGGYDLRAVLTDGSGRATTSALVTNRVVDNSPFRGVDVQTVGGGAIAGRLDAGDQVLLTYSDLVAPTTVLAGWNGSATPVTLRLRDGALLATGNKGDTLDVLRSLNGAALPLGSVNLREDYIKKSKTAQLAATMTLTTVTVNGVPASRLVVTAGALSSGGGLRTVSALAAMVWSPVAGVRDVDGRPVSVTPVTELGALDREF